MNIDILRLHKLVSSLFTHVVGAVILISLMTFPTKARAEELKQRPKLGVILPLTGRAATAGEAVRNGVSMANSDLNDLFEVYFEDNALDGARTVTAANKLIQHNKVDCLLVYASGPSNVVAPIAETSNIPMIGMSVDPNVSKNRNWVMIHWAPVKNTVDRLFEELTNRKLNKVAILSTQSQGVLEIQDYFSKNSAKHGITIAYNEQILPTELDFQTAISILKNRQPQAVFINLYYGQAGIFAKRAADLGLKPQFFGPFILDDDNEIKASAGALDGAFYANTSHGDLTFEKRYIERFGKRPVLGGIGAYDSTLLFSEAIKRSEGTKKSVMKELREMQNFKGAIGTYSALPNNSFDVPVSIRTIAQGRVAQ